MPLRELVESNEAAADVDAYTDYLIEEFAGFAVPAFLEHYYHKVELIQQQPELYPFLDDAKTVRVASLPPHHRIFYRVSDTEITVLRVWHSKRRLHDFLF